MVSLSIPRLDKRQLKSFLWSKMSSKRWMYSMRHSTWIEDQIEQLPLDWNSNRYKSLSLQRRMTQTTCLEMKMMKHVPLLLCKTRRRGRTQSQRKKMMRTTMIRWFYRLKPKHLLMKNLILMAVTQTSKVTVAKTSGRKYKIQCYWNQSLSIGKTEQF